MATGAQSQPDLFDKGRDEKFAAWVHTSAGADVANKFIRYAWALHKRGIRKYGAKGIVERLRWHYTIMRLRPGESIQERDDLRKINNNYTSRLARFAETRAPELKGLFEKRAIK